MLIRRLRKVLVETDYELILVDDGSRDGTEKVLRQQARRDRRVKYLALSRNFGHQAALKAGIDHARGACVVTMDADLQHPPETIPEMYALWQKGYDVVTARRRHAQQRGFFKNITARLFYGLLGRLTDTDMPAGAGDFRLFDRKVAEVIRALPEQDLYLRGLFAWVGFRQTTVPYDEEKRQRGRSKYGLWRMIKLAGSGITSFSVRPLKISLAAGLLFAFLAFAYGVYAIVMLVTGNTVTGWTSVIASILFLSGIQLIVLGIMGEYLGKLFMENKRRPVYIISDTNLQTTETTETIGTIGTIGTTNDDKPSKEHATLT
jgi:dolichol-phosphate mannosyltransferase